MSCKRCREAISGGDLKTRVSRMNAASDEICGCEAFSLSDASPGVVGDDERVVLIVHDPKMLLGCGLDPSALIQLDRGGLSVFREAAADEELATAANELAERAKSAGGDWFFHGACIFSARTVRYFEGSRFVCVVDTATETKPNHADLMGPEIAADSKTQLEKLRRARIKKLIDLVGDAFVSVAEYRGGSFLGLARN